MTCDESQNLIHAQLDGELAPEDRAPLEAHLAGCAACRAVAEGAAAQHAELLRAFAPRRRAARELAERVIAELPRRSAWRIPWLPMILSGAAGFAIAFGLFHAPLPAHHDVVHATSQPATQPVAQPAVPVAQLALATGAVEFLCPGDATWLPMPTGGKITAGTQVRTGPLVCCELHTTDGSEIRLNVSTQVELKSPRQFDLAGGQAWSSVAHQSTPFEARASGVLFTALGTQFDLKTTPQATVLTVVDGSVRASGRGDTGTAQTLQSGEQLSVANGRLGDKSAVRDLALATRWVNEILVLKGRDNPELAKRIDDLFAQIGQQKMGIMFEEEIRALGDHSVIPLTKYIESERSKNDSAGRALAARIVSDVAPPWAIPHLIGLLQNRDGEVRFYAAQGLKRLTGRDFGRQPEQWRTDELFACQPTTSQWRNWWAQNHDRYPGTPLELPPPPPESPVAKERVRLKKS